MASSRSSGEEVVDFDEDDEAWFEEPDNVAAWLTSRLEEKSEGFDGFKVFEIEIEVDEREAEELEVEQTAATEVGPMGEARFATSGSFSIDSMDTDSSLA